MKTLRVFVMAGVLILAGCTSSASQIAVMAPSTTTVSASKRCSTAMHSTSPISQDDIDACQEVSGNQLHVTECGNGKSWTEVTLEGSDIGMIADRAPVDMQTKLTSQALSQLCDEDPPTTIDTATDPCKTLISSGAPVLEAQFHNCVDWHESVFDESNYSCKPGFTSAYGGVEVISYDDHDWAFMVGWPPTEVPTEIGPARFDALEQLCKAPGAG